MTTQDRFSDEPRTVDPADLYDGPAPNVSQFPRPLEPRFSILPDERRDARSRPDYVATITAALDMLGARILALIATIASCGIWGWTIYQPEPQRTYAAVAFSLTVFLPAVLVYWRRG